jgi:SMI1-KNR4 cell-wall
MAGDELIRRDGGPAAEGAIAAAEHELGLELPDDYRAFLAEHDGVRLKDNLLKDARRPSGGADGLYASKELATTRDRMRHRMPAEVLPIGDAGGGDFIVLGVGGDARGRVYQWEHELEAEDPPPHWDNVTELAPSFRAWFDGLVPLTDENLPKVVVQSASVKRGFLKRMRREGRL